MSLKFEVGKPQKGKSVDDSRPLRWNVLSKYDRQKMGKVSDENKFVYTKALVTYVGQGH